MTEKGIWISLAQSALLKSRVTIPKLNLSYTDYSMLYAQSVFPSSKQLTSQWKWMPSISRAVDILLFTFHFIHIPTTHHTRADGLSCHPPSKDDPPENDDSEDWLDRAYSFSVSLLNNHIPLSSSTTNVSRYPTSTSHSHSHPLYTISALFSANPDSIPEDLELPHSPKAIAKDA